MAHKTVLPFLQTFAGVIMAIAALTAGPKAWFINFKLPDESLRPR